MIFFGKPAPKKASPPPKPKSFFEQKSHWTKRDFKRETAKDSLSIGGKAIGRHDRKKMVEELFPSARFGTHISRQEATRRLRELRRQETFAKTYKEKQKLGALKRYLEGNTGLKGKY